MGLRNSYYGYTLLCIRWCWHLCPRTTFAVRKQDVFVTTIYFRLLNFLFFFISNSVPEHMVHLTKITHIGKLKNNRPKSVYSLLYVVYPSITVSSPKHNDQEHRDELQTPYNILEVQYSWMEVQTL